MLIERPSTSRPPATASEPQDRCRFGRDFDRPLVACPAFQRTQFIAATSYGKPLGTHVACAHLVVGKLATNQFYPRCALGSDLEKMRWLAMMGPARIELLRALTAEFEADQPDSLRRLIAAKAAALMDPPDSHAGRLALAKVVRDFVSEFGAFVDTHAGRIAEIGVSPADLVARATRVLGEWQQSSRLDLPAPDEESMLRPERLNPSADTMAAAGIAATPESEGSDERPASGALEVAI